MYTGLVRPSVLSQAEIASRSNERQTVGWTDGWVVMGGKGSGVEELAQVLHVQLGLLDEAHVSASLHDDKLQVRQQAVDLLRRTDRRDPVVTAHDDQRLGPQ